MKKYEGDNFEDFLAAEGILEDVTERALKRLLALEIEDMVNAANVNRASAVETTDIALVQLTEGVS